MRYDMTDKELRRTKRLFEKESCTPERVQKRIDKSDPLIYTNGVEAWKQYARAINPGKIALTLQTLEAFHDGKSLDDVLKMLSQSRQSAANKSFALDNAIQWCVACNGEADKINFVKDQFNQRIDEIRQFAQENNMYYPYCKPRYIIPPSRVFQEFKLHEQVHELTEQTQHLITPEKREEWGECIAMVCKNGPDSQRIFNVSIEYLNALHDGKSVDEINNMFMKEHRLFQWELQRLVGTIERFGPVEGLGPYLMGRSDFALDTRNSTIIARDDVEWNQDGHDGPGGI
jgi:hypothetical protein